MPLSSALSLLLRISGSASASTAQAWLRYSRYASINPARKNNLLELHTVSSSHSRPPGFLVSMVADTHNVTGKTKISQELLPLRPFHLASITVPYIVTAIHSANLTVSRNIYPVGRSAFVQERILSKILSTRIAKLTYSSVTQTLF